MVKCTKKAILKLKTALRWRIPAAQRERIQMVLLRETQRADVDPPGCGHRVNSIMRPIENSPIDHAVSSAMNCTVASGPSNMVLTNRIPISHETMMRLAAACGKRDHLHDQSL
jgi:hypothetical protein